MYIHSTHTHTLHIQVIFVPTLLCCMVCACVRICTCLQILVAINIRTAILAFTLGFRYSKVLHALCINGIEWNGMYGCQEPNEEKQK